MPGLDARDDFLRARRGYFFARVAGRLAVGRRRPHGPRVLPDAAALPSGSPRLRVIPLRCVVGTLEPTKAFDARFRPASEHVRVRWERVALAHRTGAALPPVTVREGPDGYYVVDGRHRVSVARAMGHRDIHAWVTGTAAPSLGRPVPCSGVAA